MSRTTGAILVGVGDVPIGVDVEALVNGDAAADDVRHLLHRDERQELTGPHGPEPARAVLQLWCRKEAYLKGTGEGLTRPPNADYVGNDTSRHPSGWTIVDGPQDGGFVSSIAVHGAHAQVGWEVVPLSQLLGFG